MGLFGAMLFELGFQVSNVELAASQEHAGLAVRGGDDLREVCARVEAGLGREFVEAGDVEDGGVLLVDGGAADGFDVGAHDEYGVGGDEGFEGGVDAEGSEFEGWAAGGEEE
jgi:hypothetical protein